MRRPDPFDHPDWVFELKHDGFRAVAYISADGCRLVSRRENIFKRFNLLSETLSNLPVKDAILDGEIVCLDGDGKSRFDELLFRYGVPYYYAFDLVWLNGKDLRRLPLNERKEWLREVVKQTSNPALLYADHIERYGIDFFRMICEKDLEGKHRTSPYDASAKSIKVKNSAYTKAIDRHELFESRQVEG